MKNRPHSKLVHSFNFVLLGLLLTLVSTAQAATFTVTNTDDSGSGSLRDAITQANAAPGADIIDFNVSAASTITPLTPLPQITDTVNIGSGTRVELNGASAGDSGIGLRISAPNCVVQGLAINRFREAGIRIDGAGSNTTVQGTSIGTNLAGDTALGNFNRGILIVGTTNNVIGGGGIPNIISGNAGTGISITGGGSATVIGNFIGTNAAGDADLGNTLQGIRIADSSGSVIGGDTAAERNVISGNDSHGVAVIQTLNTTSATNNQILGNYIGVDAGGNAQLSNTGSGVLLNAAANTVGGNIAAVRNVISGNRSNGVSISTNFATNNTVSGNYIGVGANGTTALANRDNGVQISNNAINNLVGGTTAADGNVIGNNGDVGSTSARAGIYLDTTASVGNAIRRNQIFSNFGLGIDLNAIGTTANDAGDADTGANNQQNFPVVARASTNGVRGTLDAQPGATYTLDFFISPISDGTTTAEGRTYVGSKENVMPGAFVYSAVLPAGNLVTVTATAASSAFAPSAPTATFGDTSEFSAPVLVQVATAAQATVSGRVLTAAGRGIRGARVTITDQNGQTRSATTGAFGNYQFSQVEAGGTYIIGVSSKGYQFKENTQILNISGDTGEIDFIASN